MAVVSNFNPDQDQQQGQNPSGGIGSSQPIKVSGSSGAYSQTGGSGYGSSAAPTVGGNGNSNYQNGPTNSNPNSPTSSGNFTNLKSYLDANQNYNANGANGGGLAGQLYGNLSNQVDQSQNAITQGQNDWMTNNSGKDVTLTPSNNNIITQATTDPTGFINANPNNTTAFQNLYNASTNYTANPAASFDPNQSLQGQIASAQNNTNLTGTDAGRYTLLQNMYGAGAGNANYSQGQQALDNLLLQGNPNQLSTLQSAQQLGSNLNTNYNNVLSSINGKINPSTGLPTGGLLQTYANDASGVQTAAQNAAKVAGTADETTLNGLLENQQTSTNNAYNLAKKDFDSGQLTPQDMKNLGITSSDFGGTPTLWGVNTGSSGVSGDSFFNTGAPTVTLGNVAASVAGAPLASSLGSLGTLTGNTAYSTFAPATTAVNPYSGFNSQGFNSAVAGTQAKEQADYKDLVNGTTNPSPGSYLGQPFVAGDIRGTNVASSGNPITDVENLQKSMADPQSNAALRAYDQQAITALSAIIAKYGLQGTSVQGSSFKPVSR